MKKKKKKKEKKKNKGKRNFLPLKILHDVRPVSRDTRLRYGYPGAPVTTCRLGSSPDGLGGLRRSFRLSAV